MDTATMNQTPAVDIPDWLPKKARRILENWLNEGDRILQPFRLLSELPGKHTLSDRLEVRLVQLYRDICYLFNGKESRAKGYVFAVEWFVKTYRKDDTTIRRWIKKLVDAGWIVSVGKGSDRRLIPVVRPQKVVGFMPHFARLLKGVLRGKGAPYLYSSEKKNSNNSRPQNRQASAESGSPEQDGDTLVVVALLREKGIGSDTAALKLIRLRGTAACREQIEALPYRNPKNPGAVLYRSIDENWPMPPQLIAEREKEAKRVRDEQEAERLAEEAELVRAQKKQAKAAERQAEEARRQQAMEDVRRVIGEPVLTAWKQVQATMMRLPGATACRMWLRDMLPVAQSGGAVTLSTPRAGVEYMDKKHREYLSQAFSEALGQPCQVELIAADSADTPRSQTSASAGQQEAKAPVSAPPSASATAAKTDIGLLRRLETMPIAECERLLATNVTPAIAAVLRRRIAAQSAPPPSPVETPRPSRPAGPLSEIAQLLEKQFGMSTVNKKTMSERETR